MREQAEGFDVEDEAGRRAVDPKACVALRRQRVVGRVHLDDRELAGIVREPVGGRPDARWIEGAGVDQCPIGPAAGAVVEVADRPARLERQSRASGPSRHPPLRGAGRDVGAGRLPAATATPPFVRDNAASPIQTRSVLQIMGFLAKGAETPPEQWQQARLAGTEALGADTGKGRTLSRAFEQGTARRCVCCR